MKVLVLNAGSSSLKFDLWETTPESSQNNSDRRVSQGEVERVTDMSAALSQVFEKIGKADIGAVGHRIVHGGDLYHSSVIIDQKVEQDIEALGALAPLHNPHNLAGVRAARAHLPNVKHVAVFDTAFHHTLPPRAYAYGLPYDYLTEKKIRRYGFHGISHHYVSWRFTQVNGGGKPGADYKLITCHLGNGCSVCAVQYGRSVDTSMGFTPLEGLLMGTRAGDLDAGAVLYLIMHEKKAPEDLLRTLNSESGLKGMSGLSNDMRDVLQAAEGGNERAQLAVDTFCYRVQKYVGSYFAAMNGADALIFTGGIGENSAEIRARICEGLGALGMVVDAEANAAEGREPRRIGNSRVPVWVVPTQEEMMIARETMRCVPGLPHE